MDNWSIADRPLLGDKVVRLLDAAKVNCGSGAVGQAHLVFQPNGPQILQVSTAGKIRGMWSLGSRDSSDTGWLPLKELLSKWGGLGVNGETPKVALDDLAEGDINNLLATSRLTSELLTAGSDS